MSPSLVRPERAFERAYRRRASYERLVDADFLAVGGAVTATDVRRAVDRLPFDERAVLVMWEVVGRPQVSLRSGVSSGKRSARPPNTSLPQSAAQDAGGALLLRLKGRRRG